MRIGLIARSTELDYELAKTKSHLRGIISVSFRIICTSDTIPSNDKELAIILFNKPILILEIILE